MADPFLMALVAVATVPIATVGYVVVVERLLSLLPERRRPAVRPWLWLAPGLLLLLGAYVYPLVNTILLSFFNADSTQFVGLTNYVYVFTAQVMVSALKNNLLWLVFLTAFTVGLGLIFAVLFDRVRYEAAAKAVVFVPGAISMVGASVIWKLMYDFKPTGLPQTGVMNAFLTAVVPGFQAQAWLVNPLTSTPAMIAVVVWMGTGVAMVILSAALKGIPGEILEAARVDGANEWQLFWRITIPMISSTLTVVLTTTVIGALKVFDVVYVMTAGNYDTEVIARRMIQELFINYNLGRASAIAVVLFLAVTPVMLRNVGEFRRQEARR